MLIKNVQLSKSITFDVKIVIFFGCLSIYIHGSSSSDIQDYIEYIIKKHETLTTIPSIYVYINRINDKLVFITKHGYKLELQMPERIKLFGSTKKLIHKTKNLPSVEVAEVVLVSCNLADNQY